MTCLDCGHQTANTPRICPKCGSRRFQNTDSLDSFWNRFSGNSDSAGAPPEEKPRKKKSGGFFSGW